MDKLTKKGKEISITCDILFMDSFKFMVLSINKLNKNLTKEKFTSISQYYNKPYLDFFLKKEIYPYDYMDTEEKFKEKKSFILNLRKKVLRKNNMNTVKKTLGYFENKTFRAILRHIS